MTKALLPCPFCGGEPSIRTSFGSWLVECKCGADGPAMQRELKYDEYGNTYADEKLAKIEAWNRRADHAALQVDRADQLTVGSPRPLLGWKCPGCGRCYQDGHYQCEYCVPSLKDRVRGG